MKFQTYGEVLRRIQLNSERMGDEMYTYPEVFRHGSEWWGDWEGRAILSLCCLYQITENEQQEKIGGQLQEIIDHLNEYTNQFGYFGDVFNENLVNEQQLSGNSWFLRGLCEYYRLTGDEKILERIQLIADNYLACLTNSYERYPKCERGSGEVSGHLEGKIQDGWLLSTDIGCAFIMLDGITDVYSVYPSAEIKGVIEKMVAKFIGFDLTKYNFQTHATLTAVRGILRFYKQTGEMQYLEIAKQLFALYVSQGMTLNYANYNWFGKPLWTEPCAIVDSLLVASQLYKITGEREYLRYFNRIYLNALSTSQRLNGGAGCETCLTGESDGLKISLYEAYFCCTMRFAEGLKCLCDFQCIQEHDGVLIPFYNDFWCDLDGVEISMRKIENGTQGKIYINVPSDKPIKLSLYIPTNTVFIGNGRVEDCLYVLDNACGEIEIEYSVPVYTEQRMGHNVLFAGDVLLSRKNDDKAFTPIMSYIDMNKNEEEKSVQYFWYDK